MRMTTRAGAAGFVFSLAFILTVGGCSVSAPGATDGPQPTSGPTSYATGAVQITPTAVMSSAAATSQPVVTDDPAAGCQGALATLPEGTTVSAAFVTTEDRLQAWRIRFGEVNGLFAGATFNASPIAETEPPGGGPQVAGSPVTLCYFVGDFGRPRGDPPSNVPNSTLLVVIVRDKSWDIAVQGYADQLTVVDPNE